MMLSRRLAIFVSMLAIILLVGIKTTRASGGQTWYVATTGVDTNDCLSAGTPCLTIQAAVTKSSPGNTILVAAGSYADSLINLNESLTLQGVNIPARTSVPWTRRDHCGRDAVNF